MRYSTSIKIRLLVRQSQDVPVTPKRAKSWQTESGQKGGKGLFAGSL